VHVVLVAPEIAPNTGNIIRLCANTGSTLHLIEPLGFAMDDRLLKRAGLDYHELAEVTVHPSLDAASGVLTGRWFGFSSSGRRRYTDVSFKPDDVLLFGAERAGLPDAARVALGTQRVLTIPMVAGNRSLNLANAVSIVVYEAWRQHGFGDSAQEITTLTSETPGADPFDL
jgi:tRNA (cytidine/uridine-2'-O-)-methyltransferase